MIHPEDRGGFRILDDGDEDEDDEEEDDDDHDARVFGPIWFWRSVTLCSIFSHDPHLFLIGIYPS